MAQIKCRLAPFLFFLLLGSAYFTSVQTSGIEALSLGRK